MRCTKCQSKIVKNANFCHSCGQKVAGMPIVCPSCKSVNEGGAKFCSQCTCAFSQKSDLTKGVYEARYSLDFEKIGQLGNQIEGHFFAALKRCISEEHNPKKYEEYVNRFYESGMDKRFKTKAQLLAEETYTIHCRQDETVLPEIDQLLDTNFDSFIDHFIIMNCNDINEVKLPEAILKYDGKTKDDVDLAEMIFDYLDLEQEGKEKFYLDFISVPEHKIKNAWQSFLRADKKETLYLLCDQTVFGSCKEGFALTERGIYWKAHFNKAYGSHFEHLKEIKRENEWITINDKYFHVNPSFNLKMMKLLKRLKSIY